jgi:peroxiredoxin
LNTKTLTATAAIVAALTPAFVQGQKSVGPSKAAPDITIQTAQGAPARLGDYKGHVLLIDFWASWCAPCQTSFPALETLFREYQTRGVEILAVNLDERRRDADTFLRAHPHTMTIAFDPAGAAPRAFGVRGMPSSFLIDRTGTIRFTHMGYSGNIAEQYRQELTLLLSEH